MTRRGQHREPSRAGDGRCVRQPAHGPSVWLLLAAVLVATGSVLAACTGGDDPDPSAGSAPDDGAGDVSDSDSGADADPDADTGSGAGADPDGTGSAGPARDQRRPTVQLGVTNWTGARLNAAIAERLIERRLGYPVETVDIVDFLAMADDLATGEIDAVLEIWPSTLLAEERLALEDGGAVELGPLGVEGQVGWYVPRYVVDGELAVTDWEVLADPAVARAFATPQTAPRGRFLGTDPIYEQYDEELIEALDLPFEVVYSGSDAATEDALAAAVAAEEPILLYWWRPTALADRFDLVNVGLPARTDECVERFEAGGRLECQYPLDRLQKLASPGLADEAPEVERFLRAIRFSTDEQEAMIGRVDNDGEPIDAVALGWIEANRSTWEAWFE